MPEDNEIEDAMKKAYSQALLIARKFGMERGLKPSIPIKCSMNIANIDDLIDNGEDTHDNECLEDIPQEHQSEEFDSMLREVVTGDEGEDEELVRSNLLEDLVVSTSSMGLKTYNNADVSQTSRFVKVLGQSKSSSHQKVCICLVSKLRRN